MQNLLFIGLNSLLQLKEYRYMQTFTHFHSYIANFKD